MSTALAEIADGVDDAEKLMEGKSCGIDPKGPRRIVEFDVAVTSIDEKEGSVGIGVSFANIGVGVAMKSRRRAQGVFENRVRFGIPVSFGHKSKP